MKLAFNGSENRSALRAKRARVKKKEQNKAKNRVGGFAIPFAYAQQQLARASEHLQVALALFPLGAEANELMGLIFLQANDGHSAIQNFDVVASQESAGVVLRRDARAQARPGGEVRVESRPSAADLSVLV